MRSPEVSVVMPVYNGEKFLAEAISSILKQDFKDFEFIIINDGSTDKSAEIISRFKDERIMTVNNEKNLGLIKTLNKGLQLAKGEFIVRMDADDISLKKRISTQLGFMKKNKKVGVCGSFYNIVLKNKKALVDFPVESGEISAFFIFNSPIAHPTAMIRHDVLTKNNIGYSPDYIHAEDYDLWSRISAVSLLANIPKPLLNYRVHPEQITSTGKFSLEKGKSVSKIRERHLLLEGISFSEQELRLHNLISNGGKPSDKNELEESEKWLKKIVKAVTDLKNKNSVYFQKIVLERWMRVCVNFYGIKKGSVYFYKSSLYGLISIPVKMKLQLAKNFYYSWKRKKIK